MKRVVKQWWTWFDDYTQYPNGRAVDEISRVVRRYSSLMEDVLRSCSNHHCYRRTTTTMNWIRTMIPRRMRRARLVIVDYPKSRSLTEEKREKRREREDQSVIVSNYRRTYVSQLCLAMARRRKKREHTEQRQEAEEKKCKSWLHSVSLVILFFLFPFLSTFFFSSTRVLLYTATTMHRGWRTFLLLLLLAFYSFSCQIPDRDTEREGEQSEECSNAERKDCVVARRSRLNSFFSVSLLTNCKWENH